jgi:hypothetical protein
MRDPWLRSADRRSGAGSDASPKPASTACWAMPAANLVQRRKQANPAHGLVKPRNWSGHPVCPGHWVGLGDDETGLECLRRCTSKAPLSDQTVHRVVSLTFAETPGEATRDNRTAASVASSRDLPRRARRTLWSSLMSSSRPRALHISSIPFKTQSFSVTLASSQARQEQWSPWASRRARPGRGGASPACAAGRHGGARRPCTSRGAASPNRDRRQGNGVRGRNGSATVLDGQAGCGARHGWRSRSMALRMTRSLRMAAVSASFLALPAATRRR